MSENEAYQPEPCKDCGFDLNEAFHCTTCHGEGFAEVQSYFDGGAYSNQPCPDCDAGMEPEPDLDRD